MARGLNAQQLQDCGAEMLVETARLWLDLGFSSERKGGQFCINGVTGPDAYETVVNNNAYTNLMARENLRYAAETVASLRTHTPDVYTALVHKTGLAPSEGEAWQRAAERIDVPYDEQRGIVPQDDSFLDREPWDFQNTPSDRYPLLFYHSLDIYRKQVIKQADVLLAMFLLGEAFSLEAKRRNFAFYDPLTTGDSSLSSCIEAAHRGPDRRYKENEGVRADGIADGSGRRGWQCEGRLPYRLDGRYLDDAHLRVWRHAGR